MPGVSESFATARPLTVCNLITILSGSNDTGIEPLNIVIKLQTVNGRAVAKLSDTPGKAMCRDMDYLEYLKRSVAFRLDREKENKLL